MNNNRSSSQQFFLFLALAWGAMLIAQQFFGSKQSAGEARPLPKEPLAAAFAGMQPQDGAVLDATAAAVEVKKLDGDIATNERDAYAQWARLRAGLLEQYLLKNSDLAVKRYDEVINAGATDVVTAQAYFQKGDLLWRASTAGGRQPSTEAARALEALIHKGRGSSEFLNLAIYVPSQPVALQPSPDPKKLPTDSLPQAWTQQRIRDLHGTWQNPHPQGLYERVNTYYSSTTFYKIFDAAAKAFGNDPRYSYGLAILIFAILTRLLLQPLNKKQYDSMKGMAVIAPEMKKIQDKYKNKKDQESQMRMMNEIRSLQKRHGVNPMLGCGLAAVQIPVFFYVVSPFIQHFEARMELVGASFLWIDNLSRPDIPLLVVYAISQFASMRLSSTPPADEQQRQMQVMMLLFPVAVPFFLLTWPSAFTLYWMAFNVIAMFFQYRMMKSADPSKRLWNALIKQPLIPQIVTANGAPTDAVPPRPKGNTRETAVKTLSPVREPKAREAKVRSNPAVPAALAQETAQDREDPDSEDNGRPRGITVNGVPVERVTANSSNTGRPRARRKKRH